MDTLDASSQEPDHQPNPLNTRERLERRRRAVMSPAGVYSRYTPPPPIDPARLKRALNLLGSLMAGEVPGADMVGVSPPNTAEIAASYAAGELEDCLNRGPLSPAQIEDLDYLARFSITHHAVENAIDAPHKGQPLKEKIEARMAALEELDDRVRGGSPVADFAIVMLPFDFSKRAWLKALRRILDRLKGSPIYRKTWRANREALLLECDNLGARTEEIRSRRGPHTETAGWAAVRELVGNLTPTSLFGSSDEKLLLQLRGPLERLLMEGLLGADWRQKWPEVVADIETTAGPRADEAISAVEAGLEAEALYRLAALTSGQIEAMELCREGHGAARDIADVLGTSDVAVRRRLSDARKKLRPVADRSSRS